MQNSTVNIKSSYIYSLSLLLIVFCILHFIFILRVRHTFHFISMFVPHSVVYEQNINNEDNDPYKASTRMGFQILITEYLVCVAIHNDN